MQVKRSPVPANHPKQNTLIQPLIGIAKASTPVRTRIVGANSTPVNQAKLANFHKSPNNKENHSTNHIKIEGSIKTYAVHQPENRINLSPILSINKKISEGAKPMPKKSLVAELSKANEDYEHHGSRQNVQRNYQTLNESKGHQPAFNSTSNFSNLRTSNSFKGLIEARCKTPNRFETNPNSIADSKKEQPLLKESMSSNHLFKQYARDSRPKLAESRSFDRFKPIATVSSLQAQTRCMNNDGKKAKYRVINEDSDQCSDMQLYYCSKCTIPLVQQGFLVEQIGKQPTRQEAGDQSTRWLGECRSKLQNKRNSVQFILKDISQRQNQSMGQLQRYYNGIVQFIESQRDKDARGLQEYYRNRKSQASKHLQEISQVLDAMGSSKSKISPPDINSILNINERQLIGECSFQLNSESLIDTFVQNWEYNFRFAHPPSSNNQPKSTAQPISSRNHAMRFSFEKLLTDIHHKKSSIQTMMNPLQQQDEQCYDNEQGKMQKQGHTAFRDLFPEVEEAEQVSSGIYSPTFKSF